jgi:diguanylate cyclase (GGDEF)-like protein
METTLRSTKERADRLPVARYAVLLFLLIAALTAAVAVALDRNARRGTWQQNTTALAGAARVGASSFGNLRSNLRVEASELATSLQLQRAVITRNDGALERIAATRHALIEVRGHSIGMLAPSPRIASTASITDGLHVLATVTVSLPLGDDVLALIRQATPLPDHAALVLLYDGHVVAGGPKGARPHVRAGRTLFGKTPFAAEGARLEVPHASLLAVEPVSAVDAVTERYRRYVFLAALATLVLAAALATRLARPVAHAIGEVARLSRQAQTDALTGLANRRSLAERLEEEIARAQQHGTSVSFVIGDVDDFKAINDMLGHQTGDSILQAVAHAVGGSIRELDLAARYGGEEFAVVLPGSRLADAKRTAERIRRAVAEVEVTSPAGEAAGATMSFGVAEYPTYANIDALVAAADAALYQAKRGGKNQVATATVEGQQRDLGDEAPAAVAPVT